MCNVTEHEVEPQSESQGDYPRAKSVATRSFQQAHRAEEIINTKCQEWGSPVAKKRLEHHFHQIWIKVKRLEHHHFQQAAHLRDRTSKNTNFNGAYKPPKTQTIGTISPMPNCIVWIFLETNIKSTSHVVTQWRCELSPYSQRTHLNVAPWG